MNNSGIEKVADIIGIAKAGSDDIASILRGDVSSDRKGFLKDIKAADLLAAMKLREIANDEESKKKKNNIKDVVITVLVIIAIIGIVAAVAYAIYQYFTPDYLDDYEDDLEEKFEEDYFEDEEDV